MRKSGDFWFALFLVLLSVVYFVIATVQARPTYDPLGEAGFPQIVAVLMGGAGLLILFDQARGVIRQDREPDRRGEGFDSQAAAAKNQVKPVLLSPWIYLLLYVLLLPWLGYIVSSVIFGWILVRMSSSRYSPIRALLEVAGLVVAIYLFFSYGLSIRLPAGLLG